MLELPAGGHLAVEGDNLAGLSAFGDRLDGTVDLIYLDPPYNTGRERAYVDAFDSWAAFMRPRIEAAHRLLADTGVLMVSIGEDEHPALRMLTDEVFGADNRLATLVWDGTGRNAGRFTSGLDYVVVCARDMRAYTATGHSWRVPKPGVDAMLDAGRQAWDRHAPDTAAASRALSQWWSRHREAMPAGLRFYLRIDETGRVYRTSDPGSRNPANPNRYDVLHPETGRSCRTPVHGWAGPRETFKRWEADGRIVYGRDHTTTPQYKRYLDEVTMQAPDPVIRAPRQTASKYVAGLVGHNRFATPKDHRTLAEWFDVVQPARDGLVVDFFAGSGSTGEAVMALNHGDDGDRRCILITNNEVSSAQSTKLSAEGYRPRDDGWEEHGVFRSVLRPRIEAAAMRYGASWQFACVPAPSSDSGGEPHTAIA